MSFDQVCSFYIFFLDSEYYVWICFSGVFNPDSSVGVYAPDAESYKVFADLFDPIIQEYHGYGPKDTQPNVDLGEGRTGELPPLDPEGKYIISTRYVFHLIQLLWIQP